MADGDRPVAVAGTVASTTEAAIPAETVAAGDADTKAATAAASGSAGPAVASGAESRGQFVVEVADAEQRHDEGTGKAYTVYRVVVRTPFGTVDVFRRFSDFFALHQKLHARPIDSYPEACFPPKKLVGSLNERTVASRREGFNAYLSALLALPGILFYPELREFLSINVLARTEAAERVARASEEAALALASGARSAPLTPDGALVRARAGTLDELLGLFSLAPVDLSATRTR